MDTDQGATSPANGGSQNSSVDQAQSDADAQFVLDVGTSKYRDMDAVKAGVQEKDRKIAEMSKQIAELQSQTASSEAIAAIARKLDAQTAAPPPKPRDYEGEIAQLAAKLEDAELTEQHAINRKIARLEAEQLVQSSMSKVSALEAQIADMQKKTAEYDPDWVASRDIAAQLSQDWGFDPNDPGDRATLKRMVAKKRADQAQPARVRPASGFGSSTGVRSGDVDVGADSRNQQEASQIAGLLRIVNVNADVAKIKENLRKRQS
jgi:hypothetical protein